MQDRLSSLRSGKLFSRKEIYDSLKSIVEGQATPAQTGAFLMALSLRGETVEEIIGAVSFLKDKVAPVFAPEHTMDCCGTGGDSLNTYNISTASAFVLAACGVPVAKHGNRAASSQSGAADILEALDVNLNVSREGSETALEKLNFCFLMAPHHHSILKPLASLRKELGFRTIFNLLGPLANPANTKRQLIGVYQKSFLPIFANVLRELGTEKAWIVHGEDGLDEVSLSGKTFVTSLENGAIREFELSPADFGLPPIKIGDIRGGDAMENSRALMKLLEGQQTSYRDIVLANTAAALMVADKVQNLKDGVAMAAKAIDDGDPLTIFRGYRDFTHSGVFEE